MMQVKTASLSNLCMLFNTDAETLRFMLSHWIKKGKIRKCLKKPSCGSKCFKCPSLMTEIYEWVN
jgi:putative ferrous iron transport protein C